MAENLSGFLFELKKDLDFIVRHIENIAPSHQHDRYEELRSAWAEINEEGRFEETAELVEREEFQRVWFLEDVEGEEFRAREIFSMGDHGLGEGTDQLNFKLHTVEEFREGFDLVRESLDNQFEEYSDAVISRIVGPVTSDYLSAADNILGSIISAVPGGGAEAIREIKDFILDLIPWK